MFGAFVLCTCNTYFARSPWSSREACFFHDHKNFRISVGAIFLLLVQTKLSFVPWGKWSTLLWYGQEVPHIQTPYKHICSVRFDVDCTWQSLPRTTKWINITLLFSFSFIIILTLSEANNYLYYLRTLNIKVWYITKIRRAHVEILMYLISYIYNAYILIC